jgi:hypothetical protein
MSIDQAAVNRMLMSRGLGKLNDPGLIPQIGFLVGRVISDHDGFRLLIERCDPAERGAMYEAMRPYLRFEPKPLDVYVAQIGMHAEARRLASIDPVTGELRPFKVPEIKTGELGVAQAAVERGLAKFHLTLLCRQCTREQTFCGAFKDDCVALARAAGWQHRLTERPIAAADAPAEDAAALVETFQYELCPKCSGSKPHA